MDYLYLNAIVKEVYKDLPCGCPFPAEFSKSMYTTVSGMDCLSNTAVPNVLSFFTLRAKGQASAIVFSKIQKHTNSASVGRFIQSIGWTWNGDLLFRNLEDILNAGFFSEEEINNTALRGGSFALPKDRCSNYEDIRITLSPPVKQAILTTVMLRWLRFDAPLRIAVPKNVDYNSYVISAMKQIYSLFPVSLRAKAGFCSYMPSDKNVPETIFIGFVPEEMADSRTLCLDGSSAAACANLNCGTDSTPMDAFIRYIAYAPENALPGFFEELYEDLEGSGSNEKMVQVSHRDYQAIGMALNLLEVEGTLGEQISQWNRNFFAHKEREKIPARWQARIRDKIRKTINPAEFCRLAEKRLTAEAFEGLKAYREYCEGNPELTNALWDFTVALQIRRNKTYTEIYKHVLKQKRELAFAIDDAKLDKLFLEAVEEQLQMLRKRPTQNQKEIRALTAEVEELKKFSESREVADGGQRKKDILSFLNELKDCENRLVFGKMMEGFSQRKAQPHQDNLEKIQTQMDEMVSYRSKVESRADIPGVDQLLTEIDAFITSLKDRKNGLIHEGFARQYGALAAKPIKTVDQIQKAIAEARTLLAEVAAAEPIPLNMDLQNTIQAFVAEKEAEINSSNVKFHEIDKILNNRAYDYFQVLEELSKADKTQLEDHHRLTINKKLATRRPDSLEAYERNFERHYGKSLTLANVAVRSDYVVGILVRDICQLGKISLKCVSGTGAGENADRITKMMAIAEKISDENGVVVTHDGTPVTDPVWFRKVLQLSHTAATAGDKTRLERVLSKLVETNTFGGNEILPALAMLSRCGMDPSMLFLHILHGNFHGATEEQYRQAYELILHSYEESPTRALKSMQEEVEKRKENADSTALKAFRSFCRDHKPEESGKGKKLLTAIIAGLSVITVALAAVVVLLIVKEKTPADEPVATTIPTTVATQPAETEPVLVCPEEFAFYQRDMNAFDSLYGNGAADFSVQSESVAKLLDAVDEKTAAMILDSYKDSCGTMVPIDEQGTVVAWEEYFFWLCWYYADRDVTELQMATTVKNEPAVLAILQVLHDQSDEIVEHAKETTMETTEATQAEETEATEATNGTVSGETEAVEESAPSLVVSDVKTIITEAARHCYEENLADAESLLLLWELFGRDFRFDFDAHADLVEQFVLEGDEQRTVNENILKHYNTLPDESVIRFEQSGLEVGWAEYVFWECWVLAKRGTETIDENTFHSDLHTEVEEILLVIHQLVGTEEYSAAFNAATALAEKMSTIPEETAENTESNTSATEASATDLDTDDTDVQEITDVAEIEEEEKVMPAVLETMIMNAKAAFESARAVFRAIFEQVKS